jgi:hypothetical protein
LNINQKNQHKRDALIEFEPEAHKYTCAGEGDYTSVTTWLHSHFKAFDADAIIEKMMSNPVRWAKSPYYGKSPAEIKAGWDKGRDEAAAAGTAMHAAIERWASPPDPPAWVHTNKDLLEYNKTLGTEVPEHFIKFAEDFPDLTPYRTEWMIFDEDIKLAGSIDLTVGCAPRTPLLGEDALTVGCAPRTPLLGEDDLTVGCAHQAPLLGEDAVRGIKNISTSRNGGVRGGSAPLQLYDWKRCKEIKKKNDFGEWALPACIDHLPDTNYWHYALQLNTYKAILEAKYDVTISKMCLVGLHPNLPTYQLLDVPDLSAEIADLFILRKQQLKNKV